VFIGVIGVMLYSGELGGSKHDAPEPPTPADTTLARLADQTGDQTTPPSLPPAAPIPASPPPAPKEPKPPSILGRLTIAVALIASGVMAFFDYALTTFDPAPRHYLGMILGIVGLGLVVGSVIGRARGLIFVGILVAPLLILSPLAEFDLDSGVGQRRITAAAVTEVAPSYDLAIGELIIDLREVDFTDSVVELDASVGIGSLRVIVPDEVGLELDAEVGVGSVRVYGSERNGFARQIDLDRSGSGTLILNADVMVGEVRITGPDVSPQFAGVIDERITTPAQLEEFYGMDTGDLRLDLSDLVLRQPHTVRIENGMGTITVLVPDRETTTVYAHVDLGQVVLYGSEQGGFDTSVESQATGPALLTLDIDLDAGEIIVEERC
ncbi:MAG: LiaF domain-containing protein, partial [Acidimicrobiia bacterium]